MGWKDIGLLQDSKWFFKKDEWAFRKIDGKYDSLWQRLSGCGIDF